MEIFKDKSTLQEPQSASVDRGNSAEDQSPEKLYLDLMKKCLTRFVFAEKYAPVRRPKFIPQTAWRLGQKLMSPLGLDLVRPASFDPAAREEGKDWPAEAETMIGLKRLNNIEECIRDVIQRGVPGDLIETGVWRGGAAIFMRAVLKAHRDEERTVWLADSFQGIPQANPLKYPADAAAIFWNGASLAVPVEEVKENFRRYNLLDDRVRFLVGWFRDSLPTAPIERLAVLRLDGDLYESTMDSLTHLYPKLSPGGYVIIDDYAIRPCAAAVEDYRAEHKITDELRSIDWSGRFWQRLG
jgi:O-methyltransferase